MRHRFLTLQHKLTRSVQNELARLLGPGPPDLRRYESEYTSALNSFTRTLSWPELALHLKPYSLVLVGDFHSCPTSQKNFVKIVQKCSEEKGAVGVMLESFDQNHQHILQEWMDEKCDDETLLQKTAWDQHWGFPWMETKKILLACKEQKIPVFALRTADIQKSPLSEQDQIFAKNISATTSAHPEIKKWVVLIGDLHLAPTHLPAALENIGKKLSTFAVVHQDAEPIYWKLASQRKEHSIDAVQVAQNTFCINSVAPWIKQQSHVQWLRGQTLEDDEDEMDEDSFQSIVDDDQALEMIRTLGDFLGLPPAQALDEFKCVTSHDLSFLDRIRTSRRFSTEELKKIELWVTERDALFIPRENIFYFRFPKPTQMINQGSIYLHSRLTGFNDVFLSVERDFYRFLLVEAIGFLGAKILNHRVKCNQPQDFVRMHEMDDSELLKDRSQIPLRKERKILIEFILQHLKNCQNHVSGKPFVAEFPRLSIHNERPYYWIATQLGRLLGDMLFESLQQSEKNTAFLKKLWQSPLRNHSEALALYLVCLEHVSEIMDLSRTKSVRL